MLTPLLLLMSLWYPMVQVALLMAEYLKKGKYVSIEATHHFVPILVLRPLEYLDLRLIIFPTN